MSMKQSNQGTRLTFRWSYILFPVVILLLAIALTLYFYPRLPSEVAYHFKSGGSPDRWLSRGAIVLWLLLPQLILTLFAVAITWGISKLSTLFRQSEGVRIKREEIVSLMGNMVALPQAILFLATLDIFSYNSYQVHLWPLWIPSLIIMVIGGIVLGIFFIRAIRQTRGSYPLSSKE